MTAMCLIYVDLERSFRSGGHKRDIDKVDGSVIKIAKKTELSSSFSFNYCLSVPLIMTFKTLLLSQTLGQSFVGLICNMARHVIARCENFQSKGR